MAAVGDFRRFRTPEQLVSYLGLNPRVKQSGGKAATHGRITKNGRAHARGMLVEAAFTAAKIPGPLRAFYQRVRARRGTQIAIVATARKLACLCWTMIERGEDYAFARQSLTDKKLRALELRAGMPAHRGQKGTAAALLAQRSPPARARARRAGRARLSPTGRRLASQSARRTEVGRGRRQRDATEKALCGASCAAGISPRTCASLGGRPRPEPKPNPDAAHPLVNRRPSRGRGSRTPRTQNAAPRQVNPSGPGFAGVRCRRATPSRRPPHSATSTEANEPNSNARP